MFDDQGSNFISAVSGTSTRNYEDIKEENSWRFLMPGRLSSASVN